MRSHRSHRHAGSDLTTPISQGQPGPARLLVVDDNPINREVLRRHLEHAGDQVSVAEDGIEALEQLRSGPFDLVLLDILMPRMNGFQVLETLKADSSLRHLPVIVISALDNLESIVRCIELGAEDYLLKPFNPVLLRARTRASLEKKRLRDQEQAYLEQLRLERERSEHLLLNILPAPIADRLKTHPGTIADSFAEVSVLFADIVGFTQLGSRISPTQLVELLNEIFSAFDRLTKKHHLEKIKTIGDAYMVVAGLPIPRPDHAVAIAHLALEMQREIARFNRGEHEPLSIRIGISSGPVVAGVIGRDKFAYDLWGDTVNIASRMESQGEANCIQVSEATQALIADRFILEKRGVIDVRGKGAMTTYFLIGAN